MKAISLHNPYAFLIAQGIKTVETRKRPTNIRGTVLICATKSIISMDLVPDQWRGRGAAYIKSQFALMELSSGMALCTADIVDCVPMTVGHEVEACCHLYSGAWAWMLDNIQRIEPFPVRGFQGWFNVADELVKPVGAPTHTLPRGTGEGRL